MIRALGTALLRAIPTLLVTWALVFALFQLIPGDPVNIMLGGSPASPEVRATMRHDLGLDRPAPVRFVRFVGQVAKGDLGVSFRTRQKVSTMLAANVPATLELAAGGLIVGLLFGLPFGLLAGLRPGGKADFACSTIVLAAASLPNFWSGMLLIWLFGIVLQWSPILGSGLSALVLPSISAGLFVVSGFARLIRSSLIETMGQDYMRTARAKGLAPSRIILRHALPNAMIPAVTLLGMQLATMIGGAMVTENIFARPGLGTLLVESVLAKDLPVVQAIVVYTTGAYILLNLLVDLLCRLIDPRLRAEQRA
jgi:ABC-type dipeptide/oligopeptide/nickel transport system permease component